MAFGTGAIFKYIPVHQLVEAIGPEIRSTMPVFLALTENDTVFSSGGSGKKTAWNTWQNFPKVIEAFLVYNGNDDVLCTRTTGAVYRAAA